MICVNEGEMIILQDKIDATISKIEFVESQFNANEDNTQNMVADIYRLQDEVSRLEDEVTILMSKESKIIVNMDVKAIDLDSTDALLITATEEVSPNFFEKLKRELSEHFLIHNIDIPIYVLNYPIKVDILNKKI